MIMFKRIIALALLVSITLLFNITAEAPQQIQQTQQTQHTKLKILTPSFCHRETGSIQLDNGLRPF